MWKLNADGISNAAADYPDIQGKQKTEIIELATIISGMVTAAQDESTCADLFRPLLSEYILSDAPKQSTFGRANGEGAVAINKMIGKRTLDHLTEKGKQSASVLMNPGATAKLDTVVTGLGVGNDRGSWKDIETPEAQEAFKSLCLDLMDSLLGSNKAEMQARIDEIPSHALEELKTMANALVEGDATVDQKNNAIDKTYSSFLLLRGMLPGVAPSVILSDFEIPKNKGIATDVAQVTLSAVNNVKRSSAIDKWQVSESLADCFIEIQTEALAKVAKFFELCGMPVAYDQQDELLVAEDGSQFNANADVVGDQ